MRVVALIANLGLNQRETRATGQHCSTKPMTVVSHSH
jgi:hypothetical protein